MPAPKKRAKTMAEYSSYYGLDKKTLLKFEKDGVNLEDEESVRANKILIGRMDELFTDDGSEVEELARRKQLAGVIKLEREAMKVQVALEKEMKKLIELKEIEDTFLFLGNRLKGMLNRLEVELPPVLDGLEGEKMTKIIRGKLDEVYTYFEDEMKKITSDS